MILAEAVPVFPQPFAHWEVPVPERRSVCAIDGCMRPAERGDLCAAHRKRLQRGQILHSLINDRNKTAGQRLREGAIGYADACSEDDLAYARAEGTLRKAALAYAASLGWSPPAPSHDDDQREPARESA